VHDLSEAVPLADVAALAACLDLCIGVDTGLVHVAASVGMPVVVLYGPTDPRRWAPWGTRSTALRSAAVRPTIGARLRAAAGAGPVRESLHDIPYDAVAASVAALLPVWPAVRSLDLTRGSFRYEVVADPALPAAVPSAVGLSVDAVAAD
jgi:ADP-heptose:LPS heptosyltransferase